MLPGILYGLYFWLNVGIPFPPLWGDCKSVCYSSRVFFYRARNRQVTENQFACEKSVVPLRVRKREVQKDRTGAWARRDSNTRSSPCEGDVIAN